MGSPEGNLTRLKVCGCERNITNLAILNFSATIHLLENSAEFLKRDLCSRLLSGRLNVTEEFRLQVLLSIVTGSQCLSRFVESATEAISIALACHQAPQVLKSRTYQNPKHRIPDVHKIRNLVLPNC